MNLNDCYSILDVSPNLTIEDLKIKYKKLVLKFHPDKNNGDSTKFLQIKEAYDILLKEIKRRNSPTRMEFIPFQMNFQNMNPTSTTDQFTWRWNFNG